MAKKKTQYTPKTFESCKKKDRSTVIYENMMESQAWQNLSKNAVVLYLYMKRQYYGQKDIAGWQQDCFYFNKTMYVDKYHLYTNHKQFYKDRDLLIKNGFIEIAENGKCTRTKSVYRFSDKWQDAK